MTKQQQHTVKKYDIFCLFKKLLFTLKNATAAGSSQSNVSKIYI